MSLINYDDLDNFGTLLDKHAKNLKNAGVNRITVSLDPLNQNKYKKITRYGNLSKVLKGIEVAQQNNINIPIKNTSVFII